MVLIQSRVEIRPRLLVKDWMFICPPDVGSKIQGAMTSLEVGCASRHILTTLRVVRPTLVFGRGGNINSNT